MKLNYNLNDYQPSASSFVELKDGEYIFTMEEFSPDIGKDGIEKIKACFKEVETGKKVYNWYRVNHPGIGGEISKRQLSYLFFFSNTQIKGEPDTDLLIGKMIKAKIEKNNKGYFEIKRVFPVDEEPLKEPLTEEELPF